MITITPDLLRLIMSVRNVVDHGLWTAFTREFEKLNGKMRDEALHFVPDPADFNARVRQDIMRGASISLDILSHAFSDPESFVEDLVSITKQTPFVGSAEESSHY